MMGRRGLPFLCVLTLPYKYPTSKSPQILGRWVAPRTVLMPSMMLFASLLMSSIGFLLRRWNFCWSWRIRWNLPRYSSSLMSTKAAVLSASKRLSVHLQEGNFFKHFRQHHGVLQRPALLENTSIIDRDQDQRRLRLREALHIMKLKPTSRKRLSSYCPLTSATPVPLMMKRQHQ